VIGTLDGVVLDCPDPRALADSYRQLLGGRVDQGSQDWATLTGTSTIDLGFQRSPGHRAPTWPGGGANGQQLHLDVLVTDLDDAHAQVLALGATLLDESLDHASLRVFADPAGHPFCLVTD